MVGSIAFWISSNYTFQGYVVLWRPGRKRYLNPYKFRDLPGRKATILADKSLYVGNLPYRATEDEVRALFEPFGPIGEVRIIENKGFGFIDIPEENAAAAIEATNGQELGGRALMVNEARPRTDRPGGGSGRRW